MDDVACAAADFAWKDHVEFSQRINPNMVESSNGGAQMDVPAIA
jgi:hypothetical protein